MCAGERAVWSADRSLASADGRHRLRLPLVVRQHRRLDRLGVDVTLAWPVGGATVVDHVRHVVCHVVAARPLARGHHLALLHAEHPSETVDCHLAAIGLCRVTSYGQKLTKKLPTKSLTNFSVRPIV